MVDITTGADPATVAAAIQARWDSIR
jgi:hypothetical protein